MNVGFVLLTMCSAICIVCGHVAEAQTFSIREAKALEYNMQTASSAMRATNKASPLGNSCALSVSCGLPILADGPRQVFDGPPLHTNNAKVLIFVGRPGSDGPLLGF